VTFIELEKPVFVKDVTAPYRITDIDPEKQQFTVATVFGVSLPNRSWRLDYKLLADNEDSSDDHNNTKEVFKYLYNLGMRNFNHVPEEALYEVQGGEQATEELLEALRKIEDCSILIRVLSNGAQRHTFIESGDPAYDFEALCCNALISSNGQHNSVEAQRLKDAGFNVFPLEKGSVGWLIGAVKTSKGIISYE
jgi:hypothetical protein